MCSIFKCVVVVTHLIFREEEQDLPPISQPYLGGTPIRTLGQKTSSLPSLSDPYNKLTSQTPRVHKSLEPLPPAGNLSAPPNKYQRVIDSHRYK